MVSASAIIHDVGWPARPSWQGRDRPPPSRASARMRVAAAPGSADAGGALRALERRSPGAPRGTVEGASAAPTAARLGSPMDGGPGR